MRYRGFTIIKRTERIFNFLSKEFPEFFSDLKTEVGILGNTAFMVTGINNIFEEIGLERNLKIGIYVNSLNSVAQLKGYHSKWIKKIKKIDKRFNFIDFAVLHEVGHYLDYLDNPEEMLENLAQDRKLQLKINTLNFSNETIQEIYSTQCKTEATANKYALQIAETLVKLGYFEGRE